MEGTDSGQSHFGHPDLTDLGQSNLGQSIFGVVVLWLVLVWVSVVVCCVVVLLLLCCVVGVQGLSDPLRRTSLRRTQNFALFSLSRHSFFFSFFHLFWFFSWSFCCLKRRCAQMCTFGVRVVVCEPRRPGLVGPPGFHTTSREPKCAHFRVSKHHQNSTRRHPKRHRKSETVAGKGRKRAKFWAVRWRGGPVEGVRRRGPKHPPHNTQQQQNNNTAHNNTKQHTATTHSNNTEH